MPTSLCTKILETHKYPRISVAYFIKTGEAVPPLLSGCNVVPGCVRCTCTGTATTSMDSDWLTGLLVVVMVTIAVALLWSGTMFGKESDTVNVNYHVYHTGSGHKPAPIIIESPSPVIESKDNKKKPRQRTNAQQVL